MVLSEDRTKWLPNFGQAIAVSGNTAVVGAPREWGNGSGSNPPSNDLLQETGAACVFGRSGGTWTQLAYVKASNTEFMDYFGTSVAVSGDTVVTGAPGEDNTNSGINPSINDTPLSVSITGTSRSAATSPSTSNPPLASPAGKSKAPPSAPSPNPRPAFTAPWSTSPALRPRSIS